MDRKTIALVVICVAVLVFWGQITEYLGIVKPAPEQPPITVIPDTTDYQSRTQPQTQPPTQPEIEQSMPGTTIVQSIDSPIPEQLITVRTPLYTLGFTNYGGGLNKITLNEYTYHDGGNVILAESSDKVVPDFEDASGGFVTSRLAFTSNSIDFEIGAGDSPRKITYVYNHPNGGRITKTYTINADSYDIGFDITIEGIESFGFERDYNLVWGIAIPPTESNLEDDYSYYNAVTMMDEKYEFSDFDNGRMKEIQPGAADWGGMRTKYFATVMIPKSRQTDGFEAHGTEREQRIGDDNIDVREITTKLTMQIPSSGSISDSFTLFAGPLDYQMLKKYNIGLEELNSMGWIIIKPFSIGIIWLLPKIYSVLPNYGMVVLIFALLIKIITFPLSRKQAAAMAKLKDVQPKMKALQEKHKNDAGRLNKEMMKLYKEAGANPLSGCLPMLPQMPLFFALFIVFKTTIEFRGASFLGWITDLSVPDPLYVLPIIMMVSMFVQQKMTMTDPKNKMMVYMMPLIFGWLFMNFPAGLVLYWTGFNILSFVETMYVRKQMEQKNPQVKDA
ncbi:MAG: membrane protein insertase YidC [candidate division Zixibacteria bacterium]